MCENFAEQYLYSGKNIVGAIFNLKNNYSWKDESKVTHSFTFQPSKEEQDEVDKALEDV